jgi:cation diffusion facilitator family transporter
LATAHDHSAWTHGHRFDSGNPAAERGTRWVTWITLLMMAVEIVAGGWFNSMALLADGFHMASHAVAIGLSAFAYATARRHADDPRYAFGPWKVEVLAGFASAIVLLGVVALMAWGSVERLITPQPIAYGEAMAIAVVGLAVNLVCALILGDAHGHSHGHDDGHDPSHPPAHAHGHGPAHAHPHPHAPDTKTDLAVPAASDDLNLKSAYIHVLADAATSVGAILALLGGWLYGWSWLDAAVGLVGAVVVALWARTLLAQTAAVLLDREMDHPVVIDIREAVTEGGAAGDAQVADLHVWRVGKTRFACALSVVTHDPALSPDTVRSWIAQHEEVVHATIEVHLCREPRAG